MYKVWSRLRDNNSTINKLFIHSEITLSLSFALTTILLCLNTNFARTYVSL